jgi:Protein of unknown function (DUF3108)
VIAGVVLSLGPDGVRPLYAFLQHWVFGFQAIRAPARFAVMVTFGLAVLAAIGTRELVRLVVSHRGPRSESVTLAVVALLLLVELANRPLAWVDAPTLTTPAGYWLSQAKQPGAVLYLPLTIDLENTPFMVESLEHGRPIVNGYSGLRPPFYAALVDTFHTFPSVDAMWTLKDLEVRYVVSPARIDAGRWPLAERAHFDGRIIYEVVWTPEAEAKLGEPPVPVPPPVGVIPFQPGETLTYRVEWAGPAGTVSAGEIGVSAARSSDQGWRFTVTARTAPWVARFFDADDRFVTDTTPDLMPLRSERHLREGRRSVDEAVRFDTDRHVVVSDADSGRPPLRLWPGARDPIAALFYLRTQPLAPGTNLQVPVNDNGRNLILDVRVDGVEPLKLGDRTLEALRVTPVLRQRLERRQPIDLAVWLSRDARQIPLAADVHAGFGTLRLELTKDH